MYTTTIDHDTHAALLEHHEELNSEVAQAEPNHCTVIKLLTSLIFWMMDVEVAEGIGYTL